MDLGINVGLRHITRSFFTMALILQGSVHCLRFVDGGYKLAEEVVSIYGKDFYTPESREPYFVKVRRCIVKGSAESEPCWPAAATQDEIEIVVPDINNKTKFYKYIVYNHTSCECRKDKKSPELHKDLSANEASINEKEFEEKLPYNAVNLRACQTTFCSKPQPRYMNNPEGFKAYHYQIYILFYQCLPGCKRTTTIKKEIITTKPGETYYIEVPNDTACSPYKESQSPPVIGNRSNHANASNNVTNSHQCSSKIEQTHDTETGNGLLIYIGSAKIFLAALLLSFVLLSILIVDFNLCHRKKGILYNLLKFKNGKNDNGCPNCATRDQDVVEMV